MLSGIKSPLIGIRRPFGWQSDNGLRITAAALAFLNASQPYTVTGGNTISVADTRSAGGTYGVALTISGGTFSLSGTTGLTFTAGANGSATMTFTGSLANILTALASSVINSIPSDTTQTLSITFSHAATSRSVNRVVSVIAGSVVANTVAPVISGSRQYGNVLTCSTGTWTGYPAPTFTYQWQRNGSNISGQTASTYTTVVGDVGATITREVTGSNIFNSVMAETAGVVVYNIVSDLTIAWSGLTAADVGYVDGEILAGDYLEFQIDKVTTFNGVDLEETSELLDAGEISGGTFEVILPTPAEDTWYIRVRVRRGSEVSAWSAYATYSPGVVWTPSTANPALVDKSFVSATHTFTSVDFLAGLGIVFVAQNTAGRVVTSVTVNGNSATRVVRNNATAERASIWKCAVASSGSYSVVVTYDFNVSWMGISCGTLVGANTTETATATKDYAYNAQPHSTTASLTVPANGIGLALFESETPAGTTWTVGTEETDKSDTAMTLSTASLSTSGTPTVTSHNGGGTCMAAAAWGP